jgi:ABC-type transporter lipoprotein component MlaA
VGRWALTAALAWSLLAGAWAQTPPASRQPSGAPPKPPSDKVVLPESVPDPLEPVNRIIWGFNKGVLTGVVKPSGKVYRAVVVKPARQGIANFGRNLTYPARVANHLLQGKWAGARDETYRFGCNTTLGVAGFIDVASKLDIPKSDADFGQTLGTWGWRPDFFLMLPIYGPSNDRDTLGLAADSAANPLVYFTPYYWVGAKPLTWFSPYTYASWLVNYNNLTDSVENYARLTQTQEDPYWELQYSWTFLRQDKAPDFAVKGPQDPATLETLGTVFFTFRDSKFPGRGKTRSVSIPATGRKLKFTYWLQPGPAPVVYIVPGIGSHRLAASALALAELVYGKGFSAVSVSSAYNYEFMENAATTPLPAYTPVDGHDLLVALTEVDHRLEKLHPGRLGSRALLGYSMGAFHSLYLAGTAATNPAPLLQFDRYVAVDSPVRLLHGVAKLDEFFEAPLAWPAADRTNNVENAFLKAAALSKQTPKADAALPFSAIESKFLIGFAFRLILRDVIYTSQARCNQGVLEHPIKKLRRGPLYREIIEYSYQDYFRDFVIPYYRTRGIDLAAPDALAKAGDLRTYAAGLQANKNVKLILNQDDFLLSEADLAWLRATFGPGRLTVFERGGHLGNLGQPAVQKAIVAALEGLGPRTVSLSIEH